MKKVWIGFLCGAVFMLLVGFASEQLNVKYVDYKVMVNGKETKLKSQPLLKDGGTTYLPLRELAEVTGYEVGFSQGVISLNDPAATPVGTPTPEPKEEAIEWKKLPQTWEQDGISITVHAMEVGTSTDFEVTFFNDRDRPLLLYFDNGMLSNYGIEGKQSIMVTLPTPNLTTHTLAQVKRCQVQ